MKNEEKSVNNDEEIININANQELPLNIIAD